MFSIVLLSTICVASITNADDPRANSYYAKFTDSRGEKHTMYQYQGFGSRCNIGMNIKTAKSGTVTDAERDKFLKLHNDYRKKVAKGLETRGKDGVAQPAASDMREVMWDNELAAFAQRWAEQCPGGGTPHDAVRRNDRWLAVGQNVFTDSTQSMPDMNAPDPPLEANSEKAMTFWALETAYWEKSRINPFNYLSTAGHYTQIAWADVEYIGCGFYMTKQETASIFTINTWKRFVVCNYGPAGNINGNAMYKLGAAASDCPTGTVPNDGLCKSGSTAVCSANEFKCNNNQCIPKYKKCDAHNDCSDGSDEIDSACPCQPQFQFHCENKCVPTFWVCDNYKDCADNSDEDTAMCTNRKCPRLEYEFRCRSGRCIEKSWECDGLRDCPLGDDEAGCPH